MPLVYHASRARSGAPSHMTTGTDRTQDAAGATEPQDEALARAYARTGDRSALERLVALRWPGAVRFAERALGDPAAAEDAAQEACLRLLDGLRSYDPSRPFEAWWTAVLANAVRDAARSGRSRRAREETVGRRAPASALPEAERAAESKELLEHVRRLPPDVRVAVVLHFYRGLGHAEVAHALGCPLGTASSRLRRGIERLRAALGPALVASVTGALVSQEAAQAAQDRAAADAGAPPASPPPTLAALDEARILRDVALREARGFALRVKVLAACLGFAVVAAVVAPRPGGDGKLSDGRGPALTDEIAALGDKERAPTREDLIRAGAIEAGGPSSGAAPAAAPAPAPRPEAAPAASATPTAAAAPTETASAGEDDPLIRRALACLERAREVRQDLGAEYRERLEIAGVTIVAAEDDGASEARAGVFGAAQSLERRIEEMPTSPERAGRKERARRLGVLEDLALHGLLNLRRAELELREARRAAGRPAEFSASTVDLPLSQGASYERSEGYDLRVVEAGADALVLEAAPRPGGEAEMTLRMDAEGQVRIDRGAVTSSSPSYEELHRRRLADADTPPVVSRAARRLRALEGEAVALSRELGDATLALLRESSRDMAEVAQEVASLGAGERDVRMPRWRGEARPENDGGSPEADPRAGAVETALADYRLAKTDPEAAGARILERVKGSHEAAAIGALRTLTTAQALFREGDKDRNGVLDYASDLADLGRVGLIDLNLSSGRKSGYEFHISHGERLTWGVTADPIMPGFTGDRYFYCDESGVIRFSTTGTADDASTAIGG